jgi:hypothetical protein
MAASLPAPLTPKLRARQAKNPRKIDIFAEPPHLAAVRCARRKGVRPFAEAPVSMRERCRQKRQPSDPRFAFRQSGGASENE